MTPKCLNRSADLEANSSDANRNSKLRGREWSTVGFPSAGRRQLGWAFAFLWTLSAACVQPGWGQEFERMPDDAAFERYGKVPAGPKPTGLVLKKGDRLAICGDSITEQRMYSRIIETYLTACRPDLEVAVRQYGWSGERAPGFLARMTNDCIRFKPTVATTCYGMNDHEYRPYEDSIGNKYRESSSAIIQAFKTAGARVIHGSPGCVGKKPQWSKAKDASVDDLNENLFRLRGVGIELARAEQVGFADVFWPMLTLGHRARQDFGEAFALAGKDGVHPDWAGQAVMASAFLRSFGFDGPLGVIQLDLATGRAEASAGHEIQGFSQGALRMTSKRYPFCATGPKDKDNSLRGGLLLAGFYEDLNRFIFKARGGKAASYRVAWGPESRTFKAEELEAGINLALAFEINPFSEAFGKVDAAIGAKQEYETRQIKQLFHGPEGRGDMSATVGLTEKIRTSLVRKIAEAMLPVEHVLLIHPE